MKNEYPKQDAALAVKNICIGTWIDVLLRPAKRISMVKRFFISILFYINGLFSIKIGK
jgi:hypothetical protein